MNNLPTPLLGDITAFTINTPDLETSLACYKLLGFTELFRADWPFSWIQITDGVVLIMLRKDPTPYLALTYYVKQINNVVATLEKKGLLFEQTPGKKDIVKRWLIRSPDGLAVSLVNITDGFSQPPGPGMLQMKAEDYSLPEKYVNKACGLFGELAHPVADLDMSIVFWQALGFKVLSRHEAPYPWAIMSDGLAIVGLHQAGHFSYPAITYFAADMDKKVAALKANGLKGLKQKEPGHTILTTPEQQHIFLFSLGGGIEKKKPEVKPEIIETDRLLLKQLTPEIYDQLFTTCTDEEIISIMGLSGAGELKTERSNWEQGMTTYCISFRLYVMIEKASGRVVGRCGFHNWYAVHQRAELGCNLLADEHKQKGLMKEALTAVIRHGFEAMHLNRIEAFTSPGNVAALRLLRALGFTGEGVLRQHFFKEGVMHDSACFALLRSEYQQ